MQRASIGSRPSQAISTSRQKTRAQLRVIPDWVDAAPETILDFFDLLGFLAYVLGLRRRGEVAPTASDPDPAMFDEIPDTGVHEIPAYRATENVIDVVTDERLDEILRDAEPLPFLRFPVSGQKAKPVAKKKTEPDLEEDPFPTKVSAHALGQFARAYLKARGQLGEYIDRTIEARLGKKKASHLDYAERIRLRKLERKAMADLLLRISRDEGKILRDTQERLESRIEVVHIGRGPTKSYFARFDPVTGIVLGFYSAQGFNRHKAYRRARKKSYREGGRRFH